MPNTGRKVVGRIVILSRCEIAAAMDGDVVTSLRESAAHFFVVSLDPAVLADDSPRSDEGSPTLAIFSQWNHQRGRTRSLDWLRTTYYSPIDRLMVIVRRVLLLNQLISGFARPCCQFRTLP